MLESVYSPTAAGGATVMSTGSVSAKSSGTRPALYLKLAIGLFVLAVVGVAAYLALEPVRDLISSVRVEILSALGLGVVPVGAWLAVIRRR